MASPVLNLTTIVTRPVITIDGTPYELRSPEELPWLAYRGHAEVFRKAGPLLARATRTPAQEAQLERLLGPLVEALVIAPKPVLVKLSHHQRFAVLEVFSRLLPTATKTRPAGATPTRPTRARGAASSTKTGVH
jgi:hypothetical protein